MTQDSLSRKGFPPDYNWSAEPDIDRLEAAVNLRRSDLQQAMLEFRSLAERGSAISMFYIGQILLFGDNSKTIRLNEIPGHDIEEAVRWYRKAAESGYPRAYYRLGRLYLFKRDYENTRLAFEKAADYNSGATRNLATMYWKGLGVPRDAHKAKQLLESAGKQGNITAKLAQALISRRERKAVLLNFYELRLLWQVLRESIALIRHKGEEATKSDQIK